MAEFKDGMLHSYATSRDAFAALDASLMDLDAALDESPLDIHEFVRGTRNFKPPLTQEQADYAFKGLDVNCDGLLESDEFVGGIDSGVFFRPTTTTTLGSGKAEPSEAAPITMAEFKASMLRVYQSAPDAFAALDASETDLYAAVDENPINLQQFIHGTKMFDPPLSKEQAEYAFRGLDADSNGMLVSAEFSEGLARTNFPHRATLHFSTTTLSSTTRTRTTTPTTTTRTSITPTTTTPTMTVTTAQIPIELLPQHAIITMEEFKIRMLSAHASALKAFQALDANPAGLEDFIRGTRTFKPPLTEEQAVYAFRGLDADHDNSLASFEFFEVLEFGRFFPTLRDLVMMGSTSSDEDLEATPRPASKAHTGTNTTPAPSAESEAEQAGDIVKTVALITACPLLCLLLPLARALARRLSAKGERCESYKVVGPSSPLPRSYSKPLQPRYSRVKRSRFFGSGGLIGCCIRSPEEDDEPPALLCAPCRTDGGSAR